jgi:hypothetical protein
MEPIEVAQTGFKMRPYSSLTLSGEVSGESFNLLDLGLTGVRLGKCEEIGGCPVIVMQFSNGRYGFEHYEKFPDSSDESWSLARKTFAAIDGSVVRAIVEAKIAKDNERDGVVCETVDVGSPEFFPNPEVATPEEVKKDFDEAFERIIESVKP